MRHLTNNSTYEVITSRAKYAVVMEGLKNTTYGQRRFKINIITLEVNGEPKPEKVYNTATFTMKGHYFNEEGEAREAVRQYEEMLNK